MIQNKSILRKMNLKCFELMSSTRSLKMNDRYICSWFVLVCACECVECALCRQNEEIRRHQNTIQRHVVVCVLMEQR